MLRRAVPLLVALLPLLAACGGRTPPDTSLEEAFARLPDEIAGFRKQRPDDGPGRTTIARYASPTHAAASVHALEPTRRPDARDGEEAPEVDQAVEVFARAAAVDAASRRENATLRHFGARVAETGPAARCLDIQLRGAIPRRQIGCATMFRRRVFMVMMMAPEAADPRRGARDPLLAVTLRLIGAISGLPPEPISVAEPPEAPAIAPPPPPPVPAPPAPRRPRPRPAPTGPMWRA